MVKGWVSVGLMEGEEESRGRCVEKRDSREGAGRWRGNKGRWDV